MTRPFFSVVIPTYNRPQRLQTCLQAFAAQDFPKDAFEVVVVDDSSSSSPEAMVETAQQKIMARLVVQPHAGPATARNTGASVAQGQFLAFTDDDCCPHTDWLSRYASRLRQTPDRLLGGRTVNALPLNPYSTASQDLIDFLYQALNPNPDQATFFASNNIAMAAAHFQQLGGFDKHFPFAAGEDRDFCARWQDQGWGLTYAPEAVIDHSHLLSLRAFLRQHFNYGQGGYHFYRLGAKPQTSRPLPRSSFYRKLLAHTFQRQQLQRNQGWQVASLILLSQVATALGYGRELFGGDGVGKSV